MHLDIHEMMSPFDLVIFIMNFVLVLPVTIAIASLFIYQVSTCLRNLTSIETYLSKRHKRAAKRKGEANYRWPYDLGWKRNLRQMMGKTWLEVFTPGFSYDSDGYQYKMRPGHGKKSVPEVVVDKGAPQKVSKRS
eukprot:CAMPEP_0168530404 /NCGR_PEP_ID=MMETSP0405-20121227/14639_1 /TAXON_ID=498012 /ORGANISM="Trichosphaerium sp, Strain Am-I-7 wt" /LENGTH=134 /DNA_ID=CAMNT_0008554623 /DNA_START=528 /DNA_END=929 /DNA_ORIENTATION=+